MAYRVGLGGSPMDGRDEYETLDEAEAACLDMAREMAVREGLDPDDIEIYGGEDDLCRGGGGMGACPHNESGAYWPHITRSY